jgi:hypothetical protein
MAMLLVSAPVLIEGSTARAFLESAQRLAGMMSIAMENDPRRGAVGARLDAAAKAMREAVTPLLAALDRSQLRAVDTVDGDAAGDDNGAGAGGTPAPAADGDQARAGT